MRIKFRETGSKSVREEVMTDIQQFVIYFRLGPVTIEELAEEVAHDHVCML